MAISDALSEGVGAGARHGTLSCELLLELRAVESVATAIGSKMVLVIKLPRKPPLGAEDAVAMIVPYGRERAVASEA